MAKKRLMTPGPTQVPEAALLALARQVTHHRTAEFRAVLADVLAGLKTVFRTAHDVIVLTSSGTGAMEAAVVNLVPRGGKAIVLDAGVFAHRWGDICRAFDIAVVEHKVPWGQSVDPADVARLVEQHPDATAVFGTLMESSTGAAHDVRAIGQAIRESRSGGSLPLWVVDGISGAGVMECQTDQWGIDVLVVGSQKALMLPPGLAFLAISPAAWRQMERMRPQAFYFDLKVHRQKILTGPDTPWTPAHPLVAALSESLKLILSEGIEHVWSRALTLSSATLSGVAALGLTPFAEHPAAGLTAVRVPDGIDGPKLLKRLEQRFGVKLANGQGPLQGQIFRIAHLGLLDELDILGTLAALELTLDEFGYAVTLGSAVAAASQVLQAVHLSSTADGQSHADSV